MARHMNYTIINNDTEAFLHPNDKLLTYMTDVDILLLFYTAGVQVGED